MKSWYSTYPGNIPTFCLLLSFFLQFLVSVNAHGLMNRPNPRGCLKQSKFIPIGVNNNALMDKKAHFPAGNKTVAPGVGVDSQIAAVSPDPWMPYEPTKKGFKFHAGVCGDLKGGSEHLRIGKGVSRPNYYGKGEIVATYEEGGIIDVSLTIVAHHNGFMELHICDVDKCGGDISEDCFRQGHCEQLKRATSTCDTGEHKLCGPIHKDPKNKAYEGRWYLPCSQVPEGPGFYQYYGLNDSTILYKLPKKLTCKHCVLQWYWTSAATCNPPGVIDYFTGPNRPKNWPKCRGQGGAIGGFTKRQKPCGSSMRRDHFPEEYYQCADVRILPRSEMPPSPSPSRNPVSATVSASPTPSLPLPSESNKPAPTPSPRVYPSESSRPTPKEPEKDSEYDVDLHRKKGYGPIRDIVLIGDKKRIASLNDVNKVSIGKYKEVSIEALTKEKKKIEKIRFFVNGELMGSRKEAPFYMFGNDEDGYAIAWKNVPMNKKLEIKVHTKGETDKTSITFVA